MQEKKKSPLRGKYLIQNKKALFLLHAVDLFLKGKTFFSKKHFSFKEPKKVLLSNIAHLGDVLLMSSLLPVLHKYIPGVKIGILVASSSSCVLEKHPLVEKIHYLDHWKLERKKRSFFQKWRNYKNSFRKALFEIEQEQYEVAIDLGYHFPNAIPLLYKAKIPVRIGYSSGGFSPLLTHPKKWKWEKKSAAYYFLDLLFFLTISEKEKLKPSLFASIKKEESFSEYIVIHMGTGSDLKKWPIPYWKKLVEKLSLENIHLVFTGKGEKERKEVEEVVKGLASSSFSYREASWEEYVLLVKKAKGLIAVDTVAGHVASSFSIPSVLIYTGINLIENWRPLNEKAEVLVKKLPCYPCHRSRGCFSMECIRGVSPEEVFKKAKSLFQKS